MRDDLQAWLMVREAVPWHRAAPELTGPVHPLRDGIAAAAAQGRTEDSGRAERVRKAWHLAQQHAKAGHTLDFDLMAAWQRVLLDRADVPFRTLPAFAKRGQERYGLSDRTAQEFSVHIAQATNRSAGTPLASRAARAYLDVCFFHPFNDGNGRAALLALGFVLAQDDVFLDEVRPLQVRRFPHDAAGAQSLAKLVHLLATATLSRSRTQLSSPPPTRR
ncbi:Fic family protein [Streptomyces sp. NPDC050145]|uniref:Fic family protein n=1 Tax=Streptomyces sp. NPDC050145 TaxID=3365602 RepID=UPI0037B52DDD